MNTFGNIFRLTTFGESHGPAMGGIIDGAPAGMKLDLRRIQSRVDRRRPGRSSFTSQRHEEDEVRFLSGLLDGVTLGTPIGFIIGNSDCRPQDYEAISRLYRPNHADFTYEAKYGIRDPHGGGRASARETVNWVTAGAVAAEYLRAKGIESRAYISQIGKAGMGFPAGYFPKEENEIYNSPLRTPDEETEPIMAREIESAMESGDSIGGRVDCVIRGLPAGLGEPVALKFQTMLAAAMMSINAAKAFEYGLGRAAAEAHGSAVLDRWTADSSGDIRTSTNYSGGIQGGITTGADVYFSVSFKPTPTLRMEVEGISRNGVKAPIPPKGRHDPCVAIRAVPVVQAMADLVTLDAILMARASAPFDL